jgi:hypothetical protein
MHPSLCETSATTLAQPRQFRTFTEIGSTPPNINFSSTEIFYAVLIFTNVTWKGHQKDVPSFQKITQSKKIEPFFEAEYIGLIDNNTVSLF